MISDPMKIAVRLLLSRPAPKDYQTTDKKHAHDWSERQEELETASKVRRIRGAKIQSLKERKKKSLKRVIRSM